MDPLGGVRYEEMVHTMKTEQEPLIANRRHHDRAFKQDLVRQSLEAGASVSALALHNGINANMLFKWRREHLRAAGRAAATATVLLPVEVTPTAEVMSIHPPSEAAPAAPRSTPRGGVIELEIGDVQIRVRGLVDEASLCSVLRALRQTR